jgi:hypothetical protein
MIVMIKEQLLNILFPLKVEEEYRDHMAYMQARQEKEMRDLVERHRYTQIHVEIIYI